MSISLFLKERYVGNAMRPGSTLVLDRNGNMTGTGGTFMYFMEEHMEINCNMNFTNYPMDEQICYFRFLSALYKKDQLVSSFYCLRSDVSSLRHHYIISIPSCLTMTISHRILWIPNSLSSLQPQIKFPIMKSILKSWIARQRYSEPVIISIQLLDFNFD